MSDAAWVALRVELPEEIAEAVANYLIEEGAPAVVTGDQDVEAPLPPAGQVRLEAHVPAADGERVVQGLRRYLASLAALDARLGPSAISTAPVPPTDWTDVYRRHHRPVAVGRRLLVAPPWDVPEAPGREVIVIEPGMAFGTGQHATTRGCLEAIEEALAAGPVASALDVGTGSGVLAIALTRLGVGRVVACDVDPAVLAAARANLARNGAARVLLLAGGIGAVRGPCALVVANLLADALVAEARALARLVRPGGRLVVSGILAAQVDRVLAAYGGWRVIGEHAEEAWRTLTLVRG